MKIYLVGGAVRDELLGREVTERDWVVVGATPQEMQKLGYQQVGKQFPVFLHPKTNEEYALARSEKKIDKGYQGFSFDTSREVTLEEDLRRRDLTINAIAKNDDGTLVDPYHGQQDLKDKLLRHVSPAFQEDPVRLLRIARFQSRFKQYGFSIATETWQLLETMVQQGEIDALVPERVWKEWQRALTEPNPECFIETIIQCNAWPRIIQEYPPPKNQNILKAATHLTTSPVLRFAASMLDITTNKTNTISDHKNQTRKLSRRLHIPNEYREITELAVQFTEKMSNAENQTPKQILTTLQAIDIFRKPERTEELLILSTALQTTQGTPQKTIEKNAKIWKSLHQKTYQINAQEFLEKGLSGKELGEAITKRRLQIITEHAQQ